MRSLGAFFAGILRHGYVLLLGAASLALDIYERESGNAVAVPSWALWSVVAASVFVAAAWSFHDLRMRSFGRAREAVQRLRDELHNIKRRLDELDAGGLEHVIHVDRHVYRSLPTVEWNEYGALSRPALTEREYETVRDAFMDVDSFNRSVIYYPSGPATDLDTKRLRSTLDHAEDVLR